MAMRLKSLLAACAAACAVCCAACLGAPAAAWAQSVPGDTFEEAYAWAQTCVENDGLALLEGEGGAQGFELLAAEGGWELLAVSADTGWYRPGASSYAISSGSQLAGLAQLVNGGTSFSGARVALTGDIAFVKAELVPIGTQAHPFEGTFDGGGHTVRGWTITTTNDAASAQNIGLFGYCGPASTLENLSVQGARITVARSAASTQRACQVGGIVGATEGSVARLASATVLDIRVDTPQTNTETSAIARVGGVAGCVHGSVEGCSFSGKVYAFTNTAGSDAVDAFNRQVGLVVADSIGGVVGYVGQPTRQDDPTPATHGAVSGCTNTGTIEAYSPSEAGLDRFGEKISVKTAGVGGVVGYSQGGIAGCTNASRVYAPQGTLVGGIVGSFRCESVSGIGDTSTHDSGSAEDWIVCSGCTSTDASDVTGLHGGGGIAGGAGSYTTITACRNEGSVDVMRWNKPAGGGIAGQSHQNVTYCYNTGIVSTHTGGGYYCAGVVGMLLAYVTANGTPTTPTPEVYGCYHAGTVSAMRNMKSALVVGQNDGYVHDCVGLSGTLVSPEAKEGVLPDQLQVDDSASGNMVNCQVLTAEEMRGTQACAALNVRRNNDGWDDWFVCAEGVNGGFPVLASTTDAVARTSLAGASATQVQAASYTGGEAIPRVSATLAGTQLVQDVDFYVEPQAGATQLGNSYRASIVGIGHWHGRIDGACTYGIVKGDLAECTVTIASQKFDYTQKTLSAADVAVTDAYGNVLPSDWYTFAFETTTYTGSNATYAGRTLPIRYVSPASGAINMTQLYPEWSADGVYHYGYYPVRVRATSQANYTGEVTGLFKVTPASLMTDCTIEAMAYGGQTFAWDSRTSGSSTFANGTPVIAYTGSAIRPTVTKVTYLGHTLVEGVDYRIVYGNSNSDTMSDNYSTYDNVGTANANAIGCATVRFIGGGKPYDFDNYVNMYFVIHGPAAAAVPDVASCRISAPAQFATGSELCPVKLYAADGSEVGSENYVTIYRDNVDPGTASFTVLGTRGYTGRCEGTFQIRDAAASHGFVDVGADSWYVDNGALDYCVESGLFEGYDQTHFAPNGTLTRAQAALVLWRFAEPAAATTAPANNQTGLADVPNGAWYTAAANWAVRNKVISGALRADGTRAFDGEGSITREQLCQIVMNFAASLNGRDVAAETDLAALNGMPDAPQVGAWAREAVAWAIGRGVISGQVRGGKAYVAPQAAVTRAEMATIMMRCAAGDVIVPPSATLAALQADGAEEPAEAETPASGAADMAAGAADIAAGEDVPFAAAGANGEAGQAAGTAGNGEAPEKEAM